MPGLSRVLTAVVAGLLGIGNGSEALAQGPAEGSMSTPQRASSPGDPAGVATSPPQGQASGSGLGSTGGSADPNAAPGAIGLNSVPGLEGSAFGPNRGAGGPSDVFGASNLGAGGFAGGFGGFAGASGAAPGIIGDMSPLVAIRSVPGLPQPPPIPPPNSPKVPQVPNPRFRSQLSPSVRGFKIAENQSPFPQDRVFYSFNYFNDVNAKLNRYFASPINQLSVYREVFGFEKTFNEGKGSIGVRFPLNSINAQTSSGLLNQGGHSTAVGNVTFFAKYILEYNPRTGNLLSVGFAATPPTGPGHFAGARFLGGTNNTTVQPFLGYYLNLTEDRKLFLQGFLALDVPVSDNDVTLVYNDLALGYFLKRDPDATISAIVPTLEVHVNSPLNHRAEYSLNDPSGTATSVNLTSGLNVEIRRTRCSPWESSRRRPAPGPFNLEAVLLFNYRFGGSSRPRPTPVIGG